MDWQGMFTTSYPVLELVIRGSLIFLELTLLLRLTRQREAGSLTLTDLMAIILVAQSVAHDFAPDSTSLTGGFILAITVLV